MLGKGSGGDIAVSFLMICVKDRCHYFRWGGWKYTKQVVAAVGELMWSDVWFFFTHVHYIWNIRPSWLHLLSIMNIECIPALINGYWMWLCVSVCLSVSILFVSSVCPVTHPSHNILPFELFSISFSAKLCDENMITPINNWVPKSSHSQYKQPLLGRPPHNVIAGFCNCFIYLPFQL